MAAKTPVQVHAAFGVMPTTEAVMELDMAEEGMETVLSYLQVSVIYLFKTSFISHKS